MPLIRLCAASALMLVLALGTVVAPATAADRDYAPLDRVGPALTVPEADLDAAYTCHGDFSSPLQAVLFVPGTSVTVEQSFSWNYANFFEAEGRPYCTIQPPHNTQGDIQIAGEYVVHAIRETYAQAGRPIGVLGHSQGGMLPRWALRFWPDVRPMVEDQIGMGPSNHGTFGDGCTAETPCVEALWQQSPGSAFLTALNSRAETLAGIDYSVIYSDADDRVPPESSQLTTGDGDIVNVAVQSICPNTPWGHHLLVGTVDPTAHALVMDALNHPGPADPARIDPAVCGRLAMPGVTVDLEMVNIVQLFLDRAMAEVPGNPGGHPFVDAEPALRCYVTAAGCGDEPGSGDGDPRVGETGGDAPRPGDVEDPGGDSIDRPDVGEDETTGGSPVQGTAVTQVADADLPATGSDTTLKTLLAALALVVLGTQIWSVGRLNRG